MRRLQPHPVPALRRNLRGATQGEPDIPRISTRGESIIRAHVPELGKHQIARQRHAKTLTELVDDGPAKLANPHEAN